MNSAFTRTIERQTDLRRAALVTVAGAALTAACAQVHFYLPGYPVPITMQVFAVILCALALGPRLAVVAQLEYLAVGAAGAPVFAGFKAGPAALMGPTAGYIVGFVVASAVVGLVAGRLQPKSFPSQVLAGLAGVATIYLFGGAWLRLWLVACGSDFSGWGAWLFGVQPFVCWDVVKVMAAAAICSRGLSRMTNR